MICITLFCIFAFIQSLGTGDSQKKLDMPTEILIYVEGVCEKELTFSEEPTIEMVINELNVESQIATECLQMDVTLSHEDHLYIQKKQEGLISLNKATAEELMEIKGIGEKKAQAIIAGRPYTRIEDILNVKGIGEKSYQNYRPYLCL